MNLRVATELGADDSTTLSEGLTAFNKKAIGYDDYKPLYVTVRDDADTLCGGLTGETYWGWLYVDILWVREDCRATGLGSQLLAAAEDEARQRGCGSVYLDTFSFQALPFYQKHGYTVFGQLPGFPESQTRYFLTKTLRENT